MQILRILKLPEKFAKGAIAQEGYMIAEVRKDRNPG